MTDKKRPEAMAADHFEDKRDLVARWYMVNRDGMATLCTDRADAEREAADAQIVWPHMGPHRAVQLVEAADDMQLLRMGYAAARLEIESLRARIVAPAGEYPALEMNEISLNKLPPLGEPLEGGTFAGITTMPDGTRVAVVLLPERCKDLDHTAAVAWAQDRSGRLPTRLIAALLCANVKPLLPPRWHWCLETQGASYAWNCNFDDGYQVYFPKSFEGSAVAVRLIPVVGGDRNG